MSLKVEGFVRPIFWDHWDDSAKKFDPMAKAQLIAKHTKGDKINIIAKSIGSLVASYVIKQIPEQINKVIVCGIPINDIQDVEKIEIKEALRGMDKDKLICYQNVEDPHGFFSDVKEFIPEGIKLISEPRDDHHYPYYIEFNRFLNA